MTRILVVQHSPYEPLGIIIHTLKRMKLRVRYVNFARDPHQRVDMSRYHHHIIGLQFHLEVDTHLLQRWLEHPEYLEHLRRHLQTEDINAIHGATKLHLAKSMSVARRFFADFCHLFNKKIYALSSHTAGRDLF